MRAIICGGRDFWDRERAFAWFDEIHGREGIRTVISGCARGGDRLGEEWADQKGLEVQRYPAQWERYGKAAGLRRNQQMLDYGKPDLVIALPGGRGTRDMIDRATAAGVRVICPALDDVESAW